MVLATDRYTPAGGEAGTPPGDRRFRPDVQGMRAIAILLAIVYHAGLPGFSGGYVGIEVFFVISGFVITGLLLREREATGLTSIRTFYGRRARRIIPAATLVIIVTVIVTYHSLGPLIGHETAVDGQWAALFLANVHFQAVGTNYLVAQSPPSPLLNYWSLGVEEQFYIVYPTLFLLIGWWARRRSFKARLTVVLVAVIVASYACSIVLTSVNAQSAYFSLLTRSWELALGGLIAVHGAYFRRIPRAWAAVASWVGLAVILVASVTLTGSSVYPGALVAIPTLGAGLVIAAGASEPKWGVERLLRLQPFQFLAAISFSLYLWHWPILEIAAQSRGVTRLPAWDNVLLLLAAGVLATLTYYFFENPFRHSRYLGRRPWASLVVGACLIGSGLVVTTSDIHLHEQGALATPGLAGLAIGDGCPPPTKEEISSALGSGITPVRKVHARLLVVGDSTACTMLPGLEAEGDLAGFMVENAAVIGCGEVSGTIAPNFVNGENINSASRFCQSRANAAVNSALKLGSPNVVVWSSSWERDALLVGSGSHQKVLRPGSSQWDHVLMQRLTKRVRLFTDTGATVFLLTQAAFVEPGKPTHPTPADEAFLRLNSLLAKFARNRPHVHVLNLAALECPGGPPCQIIVNHLDLRGDGAHYTLEGSIYVARWLIPQLGISAPGENIDPLPVIEVDRPKSGAAVHGTYLLNATASFYTGVTKIEFEITGGALKKPMIGPATAWQFGQAYLWDTSQVRNGTYTVRAIAYNAAGKSSSSKGVKIRVVNK
jgi:peptidoglycan/LPS O-acetylase OafA/YrhL